MQISGTNGASYALLLARGKVAQRLPVPASQIDVSAKDALTKKTPAVGSVADAAQSGDDSAAVQFRDFMKQTPAEQLQTAWLARHGISKEEFAAMDPAAKKKVMEEMRHDIEEQAKQNAGAVHKPTDILA